MKQLIEQKTDSGKQGTKCARGIQGDEDENF